MRQRLLLERSGEEEPLRALRHRQRRRHGRSDSLHCGRWGDTERTRLAACCALVRVLTGVGALGTKPVLLGRRQCLQVRAAAAENDTTAHATTPSVSRLIRCGSRNNDWRTDALEVERGWAPIAAEEFAAEPTAMTRVLIQVVLRSHTRYKTYDTHSSVSSLASLAHRRDEHGTRWRRP